MMRTIVCDRDGEPGLEFEGEELARVDSSRPGKPTWTELALYQTAGGTYVVQTIARAADGHRIRSHDGWREARDWFSARTYADVDSLLGGLRDPRRAALSGLAMELLEEAANVSEALAAELDAREASTVRVH